MATTTPNQAAASNNPAPSATIQVTYAPTADAGDETDWSEPTPSAPGSFDLTSDATSSGALVARDFVDAIQNTSASHDEWLATLKELLRADAYDGLAGSNATADRFPLGDVVGDPTFEKFGTGRILGVTLTLTSGQVYVMLGRDSDAEPWRVAWWE